MSDANAELAEAKPAMLRAADAVNCLDIKMLQELKAFTSPSEDVVRVSTAVLIMKGEMRNHTWNAACKMMGNPVKFKESLQQYDANNIADKVTTAIDPFLLVPNFNYDIMVGKSKAAANLCNWVINTVLYNRIYKKVKPLMDSAAEAEKLSK